MLQSCNVPCHRNFLIIFSPFGLWTADQRDSAILPRNVMLISDRQPYAYVNASKLRLYQREDAVTDSTAPSQPPILHTFLSIQDDTLPRSSPSPTAGVALLTDHRFTQYTRRVARHSERILRISSSRTAERFNRHRLSCLRLSCMFRVLKSDFE